MTIFDGISLLSLPSKSSDLPVCLSHLYSEDTTAFLSKTLLRRDETVAPILVNPARMTIQSGIEQHCKTKLDSDEVSEFDSYRFCQALTFVGDYTVKSAISWHYLSDEQVFDLREVPISMYWSPSEEDRYASSTLFSVSQVRNAIDLYWALSRLPQDVQDHLRIPIDRWTKSKTQQGYVDKMIDLGIALESFFLRGIRDELSFRLRLRAALYLEDEIEERRLLKNEFRKIYEIRSEAVHEGTVPKQVRVNGQTVRMREFIERSQELFKRSLLKVIENGRLPDWDNIELGGGNETDDDSGQPNETQAAGSDHA